MLLVTCGSDTSAVRAKQSEWLQQYVPNGTSPVRIEAHEYEQGKITELASTESLFGEQLVYVLESPSSDESFLQEVLEAGPLFKASSIVVIVVEEKILAPLKKKYEKHASEIFVQDANKAEFNSFSLTDALAKKDKRLLWVLLQEAWLAGKSDEELIGVLWWQLKSLRLASVTHSAEEAGMKEYPYKKAKSALAHFAPTELESLAQSLLKLYHDGHGGKVPLREGLELWCLRL
jgi:DNA polymerase III delta subunit